MVLVTLGDGTLQCITTEHEWQRRLQHLVSLITYAPFPFALHTL